MITRLLFFGEDSMPAFRRLFCIRAYSSVTTCHSNLFELLAMHGPRLNIFYGLNPGRDLRISGVRGLVCKLYSNLLPGHCTIGHLDRTALVTTLWVA